MPWPGRPTIDLIERSSNEVHRRRILAAIAAVGALVTATVIVAPARRR
jgi:hypothetical protein